MSNSIDPDETAHDEPSHLDLRCLQKPIIMAYGSERVNKSCVIRLFNENLKGRLLKQKTTQTNETLKFDFIKSSLQQCRLRGCIRCLAPE